MVAPQLALTGGGNCQLWTDPKADRQITCIDQIGGNRVVVNNVLFRLLEDPKVAV
jgi:hypothetical protein